MRKQLIDYLPPVLQEVLEFKHISVAGQDSFDKFYVDIENVFNDQFFETATIHGIERYEKIYGITPKGTDTLGERRFRLKAAANRKTPYTIRALEDMIKNLVGSGNYEIWVEPEKYLLHVRIGLGATAELDTVSNLLNDIVPANMIIELTLRYILIGEIHEVKTLAEMEAIRLDEFAR